MATRKSTQAAPAATVNDSSEIVFQKQQTFALAIEKVHEILVDHDDLFLLACAGERAGTEDAEVERGVFRVMQRLVENTEKILKLREYIETLAQHASLKVEVQS